MLERFNFEKETVNLKYDENVKIVVWLKEPGSRVITMKVIIYCQQC